MPMTERYARALVAQKAKELRVAIRQLAEQTHETNDITLHKLAEVVSECMWCEREYGEVEK